MATRARLVKADEEIRANTSGLPVRSFHNAAFNIPPPLESATVAVVTTAGLHAPDESGWARGDQSFRVLDSASRDFICSHLSPNFDRSGIVRDLNVVLPLDRLDEMSSDGRIGATSPYHLAFQGAQTEDMAVLRAESGPRAAAFLKGHGVDVVILTPV